MKVTMYVIRITWDDGTNSFYGTPKYSTTATLDKAKVYNTKSGADAVCRDMIKYAAWSTWRSPNVATALSYPVEVTLP